MTCAQCGSPLTSSADSFVANEPFDVAVGRFILMFLPDPVSMLQEAGLPTPKMHVEMPLGRDADFIRLTSDLLCSLRPLAEQHKVSLRELGDLHTLADRISAEVAEANKVVSLIALVGAWSRKPATSETARIEPVEKQRE